MSGRLSLSCLVVVGLAMNPIQQIAAQESFDEVEILGEILSGTPSQFVAYQVSRNGITSKPNSGYYATLRRAGAPEFLIKTLRSAKKRKPENSIPGFASLEKRVVAHLAQAAEFTSQTKLSQGEQECRAALQLLPQRPVLHEFLGAILWRESRREAALAEYRESVRLAPSRTRGHFLLGSALAGTGDLNAAIVEFREAARLRPESAILHNSLGQALYEKGDLEEAITEYRESIRLWPDYVEAHFNMGNAFFQKGDWTGPVRDIVRQCASTRTFLMPTITWAPHC